jgi:hypothetical protein
MRTWTKAAALALLFSTTTTGNTQGPAPQPGDAKLPAPGTRGNADNVPYVGKRDPKGNPVRLARTTGHVSNYTEEKVPAYTLPDPLVLANGQRVTSAEMWGKQRRPEILKFYQTEIYGRIPDNAPKVAWQVTETDKNARQGTAVLRRVIGKMGDKPDGRRMNLTIYTPVKAEKPVPLLLSITFGFLTGRGPRSGAFDLIGEVLSRGWGYASLGYTDIQPSGRSLDRRRHRTELEAGTGAAPPRRMGHH